MTAALFGGMVFFVAGVAPQVFRALKPEDAGAFLRRLFPVYYAFIILTSGLAAVGVFLEGRMIAAVAMASVALSTLVIRQALTPRLNAWRDAEATGDTAAGRKFKIGHRLSVIVNLVQLIATAIVLAAPVFG